MGSFGLDGHLYAKKGLVPSLLLLPLVALAQIIPPLALRAAAMLLNPLLLTATALLIYRFARHLDFRPAASLHRRAALRSGQLRHRLQRRLCLANRWRALLLLWAVYCAYRFRLRHRHLLADLRRDRAGPAGRHQPELSAAGPAAGSLHFRLRSPATRAEHRPNGPALLADRRRTAGLQCGPLRRAPDHRLQFCRGRGLQLALLAGCLRPVAESVSRPILVQPGDAAVDLRSLALQPPDAAPDPFYPAAGRCADGCLCLLVELARWIRLGAALPAAGAAAANPVPAAGHAAACGPERSAAAGDTVCADPDPRPAL